MYASEKFLDLYKDMNQAMEALMSAISKLSKGYLPSEIFPPHRLKNITQTVLEIVQKTNPDYTLALTHITQYYDMKLVTFSVDPLHHSLIITFPILIKHYHRDSLTLFEIETVPVPINDQNENDNSYTQVVIDKPYLAVNDDYYIQLRIQELRMCKQIQYRYFCEELFLVKHKSKHSCASAIYFDLSPQVIKDNCKVDYLSNATVVPSVLDGGNQIVLANILNQKKLICTDNANLATPLPSHQYVLVNRSILCNCEIEAGFTYVLRSLGACTDENHLPPMYFTINMAFFNMFQEFLNITKQAPSQPSLTEWKFPISLSPDNQSNSGQLTMKGPTELKNLLAKMKENQRNFQDSTPPNSEFHEELLEKIATPPAKIFIFVAAILACIAVAGTVLIVLKLKKMGITIAGLSFASIPTVQAMPAEDQVDLISCPEPWLTYLLAVISLVSLALYLFNNWEVFSCWIGIRYINTNVIYLCLGDEETFVPLKLVHSLGTSFKFNVNNPIKADQVRLSKFFLWDILQINWELHETSLTLNSKEILLPKQLTISLFNKFKVRNQLNNPSVQTDIMIMHLNTWYKPYLTAN
jgi:hypothetical protein